MLMFALGMIAGAAALALGLFVLFMTSIDNDLKDDSYPTPHDGGE